MNKGNIHIQEFNSVMDKQTINFNDITLSEIKKPETVIQSGIYINDKDQQWEIWFVPEPDDVEDLMHPFIDEAVMMGFCSYRLGYQMKEIWKHEFFQRWSGMRNDVDGWQC